jgi:hypothetical protein
MTYGIQIRQGQAGVNYYYLLGHMKHMEKA